MLKIYGHPMTRTFRTLWMAEELGLEFELVPLRGRGSGETRTPEFLKLNPNGHVPTIVDGDLVLWESMAINLHLARKYGGETGLWPAHLDQQALATQWSFWAMTEAEPPLMQVLQNRVLREGAERDESAAREGEERLRGALSVLDGALSRPHLLGEAFRVADLNVASVLFWLRIARVDVDAFPRVAGWLKGCMRRDAARAARERQSAAAAS